MEQDQSLIKFLEKLDTEMARLMLQDLRDDSKRTPSLYTAVNKLLDRHKFQINKLQPEGDVLGALSDSLSEYKMLIAENQKDAWN